MPPRLHPSPAFALPPIPPRRLYLRGTCTYQAGCRFGHYQIDLSPADGPPRGMAAEAVLVQRALKGQPEAAEQVRARRHACMCSTRLEI